MGSKLEASDLMRPLVYPAAGLELDEVPQDFRDYAVNSGAEVAGALEGETRDTCAAG